MPVALNLYKIREAEGPAGEFFRSVVQQKPQYQGLWLVTADGKVLMGHQDTDKMTDWHGEWAQKVLSDLETGLATFGPISARELAKFASNLYQQALPHRGVGEQTDGSVTLAVYDKFVIVQDLERDPPADAIGSMVLDSIHLDADTWKSLNPTSATAGTKWSVPEQTARRFFPMLSTGDTTFRDANEVTDVEFRGEVEAVENGLAYLRFTGNIAATHHGTKNEGKEGNKCSSEATMIDGVGVFDVAVGRMTSLTLVFDGRWRNYAPYDDPATRFGAVVQWKNGGTE